MDAIVVTMLVNKLGSILANKVRLQLGGSEDDIRDIMEELTRITCFLKDLSSRQRQDHDKEIEMWMRQAREFVYEAEDIIDAFGYYFETRRPVEERGFICFLNRICWPLRKWKIHRRFAIDVPKLKLRARVLTERSPRYSLAIDVSERRVDYSLTSGWRCFAPFMEEDQPVGIDEHRDKLIGWMRQNQSQLGVISLVGFGGLGKTTLAKWVYQSPALTDDRFQARAWVAVSQSYKIEALLRTIIRQLSISEQEIRHISGEVLAMHGGVEQLLDKMREVKLKKKINDCLKDKKYLIVLDDVWSISAWDNLKDALPDNTNGSSVIVTTRLVTVANAACSNGTHNHIYRIPPLSPQQSRELFCKRVFDGPCPQGLTDLSDLIIKKCDGLPLAIVTIASFLSTKQRTVKEWQTFYDRFSLELEAHPTLERTKQVLALSYNDLPDHLKSCFLYVSIFPKDHEINRKRLVRRWVAEGFVSSRHRMSEEEVAQEYFEELVNRSLMQPVRIGADGKVKSCRAHDIMREVIVAIASEEHFATVVGEDSTEIPPAPARRLALHGTSTLKDHHYLSKVRSLTTFGNKVPLQDCGNLRLLRVLDLQGCEGLSDNDLKNISKCFFLNFLSLRNSSVRKLPDSIGDLHRLQTLDIRECKMKKLPNTVAKLQKLQYLLGGRKHHFGAKESRDSVSWSAIGLPKGVGEMKQLRNLGLIDVNESGVLQEIGELTQLENLSIALHQEFSRERPEHFLTSLRRRSLTLRSLTLLSRGDALARVLFDLSADSAPPLLLRKMRLEGRMETLPEWFTSLKDIAKITFRSTYLRRDALDVLKDNLKLIQLVLGSDSFDQQEVHFDDKGFPSLRFLQIDSQGVHFEESTSTLPNLEGLKLTGDFANRAISGLQYLPKLKVIYLDTHDNQRLKDMLGGNFEERNKDPIQQSPGVQLWRR